MKADEIAGYYISPLKGHPMYSESDYEDHIKELTKAIEDFSDQQCREVAVEFLDYIVRANGQVAVLYGKNEKLTDTDIDVQDLFDKWYTNYKNKQS